MNFKLFLEKNISDFLSSIDVKSLKQEIKSFLQDHLSGRDLDVAVNLFAYIYYNEGKGDIKKDWTEFGDYLSANLSTNRTKLVNHIKREDLEDLNNKYHININITNKNLRKGPEGQALVSVSERLTELNKIIKLPAEFKPSLWNGWNWTSLGCGRSSEEGAAGGHCGNSAGKSGDNIFSLRNNNNQVLLTFIVNIKNGSLGESKGINNTKPKKELHPAIVALLTSKYVKKIEGGGYAPEYNFTLEDINYNKDLYDYLNNHLGETKSHETPENYLPLSFLTNLTDEMIHVKYPLPDDKFKLLNDILNVFSNYKIFHYDEEEKIKKFEPIPIRINLDKLIKSSLSQKDTNNKKLLEILDKVSKIYEDNKIYHKGEISIFRPNLTEYCEECKGTGSRMTARGSTGYCNVCGGSGFKAKKDIKLDLSDDGYLNNYIKKIENVNIDENTVKYILEKVSNKKLNLREKNSLLNSLTKISGRDYSEIVENNQSNYSFFDKLVVEKTEEIIRDCLSYPKIPEYVSSIIVEFINSRLENIIQLSHQGGSFRKIPCSFDYKKQKINFTVYGSYLTWGPETEKQDSLVGKKVAKIYPEIKHKFTKKGIYAPQDIVIVSINSVFQQTLFQKFIESITKNYGFTKISNYYKGKPSTLPSIGKRMDVKEVLETLINKKILNLPLEMYKDIEECRDKVFNKLYNKLKRFIEINFDKICENVKNNPMRLAKFGSTKTHSSKIKYETEKEISDERRKTQNFIRQKKQKELSDQLSRYRNWPFEHKLNFKEWIKN